MLKVIASIRMAVVLGMLLVTVIGYGLLRYLAAPPVSIPFNSNQWQGVTAYDGSDVRARMLDDLRAQHPLLTLSHSDVDRLLGPGDATGHWSEWDRNYWLKDVMIDSQWLVLRFDAEGKVAESDVVED